MLINKLTSLDKIDSTINSLLDETSDALSSVSSINCQFPQQALQALNSKLTSFFAKLSLSNSIITDKPTYSLVDPKMGNLVSATTSEPDGLSFELQKYLCFILSQYLTQIHSCLFYVHKLLDTIKTGPSIYPSPSNSGVGLHPNPFSPISCNQFVHPLILKLTNKKTGQLNQM